MHDSYPVITHSLRLAAVPFDAIASGKKTIESRLFDEKRQKVAIGDKIIFTNRENAEETVTARVTGLLHEATFHDLFVGNGPDRFGGESIEQLDNQIKEFYSDDDQRVYGVVGIEFMLI